jgi:hypothetical protein
MKCDVCGESPTSEEVIFSSLQERGHPILLLSRGKTKKCHLM